jgi:hypothetical protein
VTTTWAIGGGNAGAVSTAPGTGCCPPFEQAEVPASTTIIRENTKERFLDRMGSLIGGGHCSQVRLLSA